jgi:hypothetical protein
MIVKTQNAKKSPPLVGTKLGSVKKLTNRTWQGDKDDGSETKDNDKYHTD